MRTHHAGFARRWLAVAAASVLATAAAWQSARAQSFPSRAITITVPYSAGGPTDSIARIIAEHMGRTLAQTFIVDNATGGGGSLAGAKVAAAPPDGYTILIQHLALLGQNKLYPNVPYDPRTALVPVGLVNKGPLVLVARKTIPASTPAEYFAWIKAQKDKVNVGHAGLGTNAHLCAVELALALGTKFNLITYRGSAPALNDLMAGQIDFYCDQTTSSVPLIQGGNIKAIAVTTLERSEAIPDVPTMTEVGLPAVLYSVWHGLYAPKGTPPDVVDKLNAALAAAVADPEVQKKFAFVGTVPFPPGQRTPAAHAALFAADFVRINKLIDDAGLGGEAPK